MNKDSIAPEPIELSDKTKTPPIQTNTQKYTIQAYRMDLYRSYVLWWVSIEKKLFVTQAKNRAINPRQK